jgi:hypothetical protein
MRVLIGVLVFALAATTASAAVYYTGANGYYWGENFESATVGSLPTGWTNWTQAGNTNPKGEAEGTTLGNVPVVSVSNNTALHEGGINCNGGAWTTIDMTNIATGVPVSLDGFWRTDQFKASYMWCEVIVYASATWTPTTGTDINTNAAAFKDGSLTNGEMIYKVDTYTAPYNVSPGWNGQMSTTNVYEKGGAGGNGLLGNRASGWGNRLVLVLKAGNGQTSGTVTTGADFDDIYLTPEPAALALLTLGLPLFLRRRRA